MAATLWHIEISHYNEKVRWALDYKGIPYELRTPIPGLHGITALRLTRGAHRRLPVIDLDGRRIADSTAIIAALEQYRPDPPLYPTDPADRRRALELEDFFDEEVAPQVRRYVWSQTLDDTDAVIDATVSRDPSWRQQVMRRMLPLARPIVRADYGVDGAAPVDALARIRAGMDRLEAEIQPNGYLAGDSFSVADLTAASLFTPALCPPGRSYPPKSITPTVAELREELAARDGGKWITEIYARHRGAPLALAS